MPTGKSKKDFVPKGKKGNPAPGHKGYEVLSPDTQRLVFGKGDQDDEPLCPTVVHVRSEIENLMALGRRFR